MNTSRRLVEIDERLEKIRAEEQALKDERRLMEDQFLRYIEDTPDIVPDSTGHWSQTVGDRTVYLAHETWASVPKEKRAAAVKAMEAEGIGDLVDRTNINSQTLSAWVRELPEDEDGHPILPARLVDFIKVSQPIKVKTRKRS